MNLADTTAWLATLKVGDEIAIPYGWNHHDILVISRVTPTQIICGEARFTRTSGRWIGKRGGQASYIKPATPHVRESVERRQLISATRFRSDKMWETTPTATLRMIVALLNTADGGHE